MQNICSADIGETDNLNFWNVYADYAHKHYAYKINLVQ